MEHTLEAIIRRTADKDSYFAFVPELKGCNTQGGSLDDVMRNIKEAIDLYLSKHRPPGMK